MLPVPRTYSTITNGVADKENPQDDGVLHQATKSNNKDPPPDDPPKNHDNKAISCDTDEPFTDPDQLNHTTYNTINANIVQQQIIIENLDK